MLSVPILFLIFNRPDTTRQVFEAIREVKPKQLFVAADGPRINRPDDAAKCSETRKIIEEIDWSCEVKTLFREHNLGCKEAVSSAINWFFEHVEEGVILEDDCQPNMSFFSFCSNLLTLYRNNETIMHISGSNFQFGKRRGSSSYYFSKYSHIWGWATWRRAWKYYDVSMKSFKDLIDKETIGSNVKLSVQEREYWKIIFNRTLDINTSTWDYQWLFTCWAYNGISITPNINLVSNIGFGEDATHTIQTDNKVSNLKREVFLDIVHPQNIRVDEVADQRTFINYYHQPEPLINKIRSLVYRILPPALLNSYRSLKVKASS